MAEYPDFSAYSYFDVFYRPGTVNIGWIDVTKPFKKAEPSSKFLDALFHYARVSIALARGAHFCDACGYDAYMSGFGRSRECLRLGMAEIRVFSNSDIIYAAPNLIYHYVADHSYSPPEEFIQAVLAGPRPPDPEYFAQLKRLGLDWWETRRAPDQA